MSKHILLVHDLEMCIRDRAQVINLLNDLRNKMGLTIMFIAHNLSVVAVDEVSGFDFPQGRLVHRVVMLLQGLVLNALPMLLAVSYTHLDVYKRQVLMKSINCTAS